MITTEEPRGNGGRTEEDVGVMKDKDLKLEEIEVSLTLCFILGRVEDWNRFHDLDMGTRFLAPYTFLLPVTCLIRVSR